MTSSQDVSKKFGLLSLRDSEAPSSRDVKENLRLLQNLHTKYHEIDQAKGSQPAQISGIWCKKCQKFTCSGCRGKPKLGRKTIPTPVAAINHCCDEGRLSGIYVLLSRFDEVELLLQQGAAEMARKNASRMTGDKGTGYSQDDMPYGYSYYQGNGYYRGSDRLDWRATPSDPQQQDDKADNMFMQLMVLLTAFIPEAMSKSSFDKSPPPGLLSIFRMSLLVDRVAALVRDDSIADMGMRAGLYNAVLEFIMATAGHPVLVKLLVEERPDKKRSPGLQYIGDSTQRPAFDFDSSTAGMRISLVTTGADTPSMRKHLQIFPGNKALAKDFKSDKSQESMAICKQLFKFYKVIQQNALEASCKNGPYGGPVEGNRITDHLASSRRLPEDFGIRPDAMKVLITGVEGTPYEGGLFS
ncbi:hypothetical protein BDZ45DRAFT_685202 [Acephala macrosclerotiorum]|nr:hypothetical protein BDZ45DRAFT_685202 [Acephala macrosclerotiorum]